MNRSQTLGIVDGQRSFLYPVDFVPRDWQIECLEAFTELLESPPDYARQPLRFLVSACVAAGKTDLSAMLCAFALNQNFAKRVVFVAPNRSILTSAARKFRRFGIDLAKVIPGRPDGGESPAKDGAITTYQTMIQNERLMARMCEDRDTVVILDEIHHLGDILAWGSKAERAFAMAKVVVGTSGTPWRTDNREIALMESVTDGSIRRFLAKKPFGFSYSLNRAINEDVVRRPVVHFLNADVEITHPNGTVETVDFKHDFGDNIKLFNVRLQGAVKHGSVSRTQALAYALKYCRESGRKLIIFVGGDSYAEQIAKRDAEDHLPEELQRLGVDVEKIEVITSDSKNSVKRIGEFGKSDKEILIAINMISEGVDIPELSAALFLTSITAKATTIQRIGRVLRKRFKADPLFSALVFMFEDPRYLDVTKDLECIEVYNVDLSRDVRPGDVNSERQARRPREIDSIGLNARPDGRMVGNVHYTNAEIEHAERWCAENNWPLTQVDIALPMLARRPVE